MDNLHIFLGATVADAATRPLHWVYDPKKLKKYIKGKKEIAFLKKNRSPFYNIKTGKVSGYNDIGQVMFQTLISSKKKSQIFLTLICAVQKIANLVDLEKTLKNEPLRMGQAHHSCAQTPRFSSLFWEVFQTTHSFIHSARSRYRSCPYRRERAPKNLG